MGAEGADSLAAIGRFPYAILKGIGAEGADFSKILKISLGIP